LFSPKQNTKHHALHKTKHLLYIITTMQFNNTYHLVYRETMEIMNVQDNNYAKLGVSANPVYSSLRKFERVRS